MAIGYVDVAEVRDGAAADRALERGSGAVMAWVRFPDGSRRKVERVDKAAAQRDLDELLALRARTLEPPPRSQRLTTFAQVGDAWVEAGCPIASPTAASRHSREKSPNTIANARQLLGSHVVPAVGRLWVDRTATGRLEELFAALAGKGYATSTWTGPGSTSTRRANGRCARG